MQALRHPTFLKHVSELGSGSDRIWLVGASTGLIFTLIAAYFFPVETSQAGVFWAYASILIRMGLYWTAKENLEGRGGESLTILFQIGLVAGFFELLVDFALVHGVQSGKLIYLGKNDVVLLASPIWMPFAWACVIVEMGYPAMRLFGIFSRNLSTGKAAAFASVLIGLMSGVTVGLYEYFAARAGWWRYEPAKAMIGKDCALFIPAGEFLMFLCILPITASVINNANKRRSAIVWGGTLFAVAIGAGYFLAYLVLEVL